MPFSIEQLLKFTSGLLRNIGIDTAYLDSRLLLGHVKGLDSLGLIVQKDQLLKDCMALLQTMPSPMVRDQYLEEVRKKLGLKNIRMQMPRSAGPTTQVVASAAGQGTEKTDMIAVFAGAVPGGRPKDEALAEWQLLQLLLSSGQACAWALERLQLEWLSVETVRNLADHLLAFAEESGGLDIKIFLDRLSSEDQDTIAGMRLIEGMDESQQKKHFSGILFALEIRSLQKQKTMEKDLIKYADIVKRLNELQSKPKGGSL